MSNNDYENPGSEGPESIDDEVHDESPPVSKEPRRRRRGRRAMQRKSYGSVASFLVWAAFLIFWLFFFAVDYGIFENIAVAAASFVLIGGANALIWIPPTAGPEGSAWRTRVSVLSGVLWVAFVILWLPFFAEGFTLYHNAAILLTSFLVLAGVNALAWASVEGPEIRKELGRRPGAGIVVFILWLIFTDYWLWFQAEGYVWEQNVAIGILSVMVVFALETAIFSSYRRGLRSEVAGVGLAFVWMIVLFIWFWFFAEPFNVYQNFAIVLVSLFVVVAIGMALGRRYWPGIDDMDWKDEE